MKAFHTADFFTAHCSAMFKHRARVMLSTAMLFACFSAQAVIYTPPSDGLVAWWRGEGNGDDSANGHNGIVGSGVNFVPGISGQAFDFTLDGASSGTSRVHVPDDDAFKLTGSLSIAAWISGNTHSWAILQRGDYRPGLDPYTFSFSPSGYLAFGIASANDHTLLELPTLLPDNQWMHVAATLDDLTGSMRIYVNGALAAETFTSVRPLAELDPLHTPSVGVGNSAAFHNFPFIGQIDEVLLYGRALSPSEIEALAIPEPSVLTLSALAGLAVARRRRCV
jgi:hypothetical protein